MMDRCTWYTTFETTKGDIQLSLQKGDFGQYFVLLKYYDKINTDTVHFIHAEKAMRVTHRFFCN